MKKLTLLAAGLLTCSSLFSQKKPSNVSKSEEITVTFHGETGRLIDYIEPSGTVNEIVKNLKTGYHPKDDWQLHESVNPNALPHGIDQSLQISYAPPALPTKALDYSWDAISNFNVSPADPTVDVGPNHVVQMTNGPSGAYIRVYSKTGTPIGSQVYFDNFMGMPGGLGDPIVLYDERADRWFLSEFSASGNNLHIAISTTPDPAGSHYTYSFNSASGFPDYPKYSIWEDSYIMTANVGAPDVWALNRTAMLAGGATTAQKFSQANYGTIGFQASTPVSLLGTALPPTNAPAMVMRMRDDAWSGSASDALEIWELDIDWVTPGNSTFALSDLLPMNFPFDSELCGYTSFTCIDQPGSNTNLDPLREVLMNRIMYRNFGTHESIVCCHVTDVTGGDDAGIRWYELRRTGGLGGTWVIYQESTYAPDSDSRWMPTIGISESGNIGLAYNVSSASTYPSIRYTGRKECDPLNQMTEPETVIVAGTTYNSSNRYGDYNAMGVDPSDGETFYMTGMYNPVTAGRTRIGAFSIDVCTTDPEVEFDISSATVNEGDADVVNGCLDYYVVDIPISIGLAPSQDADVTINVAGGTATEGVDFDLVNNIITLNAGNMTGTAQVYIYNDDYVESTETIVLDYTLNANGGDAYTGASNQTVVITINDDDIDLASMTMSTTIFSENFNSGLGTFTTVNNAGGPQNEPFQVDDAAGASSTAWTVPTSNTSTFAYVNDDNCDCDQNDVDLNSPSFNLAGYSSAELTYNSYYLNNEYAGDQETAIINISVNSGPFTLLSTVPATADWTVNTVDLSAYVGITDVKLQFNYSDGTGWLYGWAVDDVTINGINPIGVQTVVNTGAGMESNLGPNETVNFIDPTSGNVMMTLENTSNWDYGCVTVEVDRDGTSASQFNSASTGDFVHDKTYTVTPTNNNPSGTYNVTVYYEEAEVAGWEATTGNSRNNAEIIKVAGNNAIGDVNPGNFGSFTIVNMPSTVAAFNADVSFTSSFSTGFSGFGVGIYNPGNIPPTADFAASSTSVCVGETVDFSDQSSGGATSWDWDFGDGSGTSTQQNPSYSYASNGSFDVILTATNGNGSDTYTATITVNALPSVNASATATSICNGSSTTLNASGASSYSWDNGAGSGASVSVSPSSTTTYTVTGLDANGCENTDAVTITVNPNPTISISGTSSPSACGTATGSATIGTSGSGNISWTGTSSGSASGITLPYTATGLAAGTYNFTFTNTNGCVSNISTATITDPGAPAAPTVTPGTSVSLCQGESAVLSSSYGSGNTWSTTESTQDITVSAAGDYSVYYTDGSGCVSSLTTVTVTVNSNPSVTAGSDQEICDGASATLTASGASTYAWDNGAGNGSSVSVSPTSTTTYVVTGTDANGCVGTDDIMITVNPLPTVDITPAVIDTMCVTSTNTVTLVGSPNGGTFSGTGVSGTTFDPVSAGVGTHIITYAYTDGNGCSNSTTIQAVVDSCSGIGENYLDGVSLSPNPNDGNFEIIGLDKGSSYVIYDSRGRLVLDGKIDTKDEKVEIRNVEAGVYYLHGSANGSKGILKFIVAK